MKKILIALTILISLSAKSQTDTTKLTAKYIYEDVKSGFSKLVSSLEGPAKHTYEAYVKQYFFIGVATAIGYIVPLIFIGIISMLSFRRGKWEESVPKNKWAVAQIWTTILMCGLLLGIILSLPTFMSQIFNPEYHAIQDIISSIK